MRQNEQKNADSWGDATSTNDGIRKTAVFLSVLDQKSAREMLARLESAVAEAVAAEMKRVGTLAPEDVEAILAEFLTLNEKKGSANVSNVSAAGVSDVAAARRSSSNERNLTNETTAVSEPIPPKKNETSDNFRALDAFDAATLAKILRDERASTVAVVASRLSEKRRDDLLRQLPTELRETATRLAASLEGTTETSQFLEDAVFDRALGDE